MSLSITNKIAISGASVGGISGAVAYAHHELSKITLAEKLKGTLIQNEEIIWAARATKLDGDNGQLSDSLKLVKDPKDAKGDKLKAWCQESLKNTFSSESDQLFKEAEKYCVYNIKEKAGTVIEENAWKLDTHNTKLNNKTDKDNLSTEMKRIKEALKPDHTKSEELKKWCLNAYEKPFKGEKDQDFKDTKEYCVAQQ